MKLFLTIVLLALSPMTSFSQQALSNKPPTAFGPVKTIKYEYYSYEFSRDKTRIDESVPNGRKVVWLLDSKGKPVSREIFEKDGRASGSKRVYKYDSNGLLTSMTDYMFGKLSCTETFAYPAERLVRITRVFELHSTRSTEVETDEFDNAGRITKATFLDEEGTRTESYKYDEKGNPTEFIATDRFGKQLIKETYQYEFDKNGNWTEQRSKVQAPECLGIPPATTIKRKLTYY